MKWTEYVLKFPESTEIGRSMTGNELELYHDNGKNVGCWRENRRTGLGEGEILSTDNAFIARGYFQGRGR